MTKLGWNRKRAARKAGTTGLDLYLALTATHDDLHRVMGVTFRMVNTSEKQCRVGAPE